MAAAVLHAPYTFLDWWFALYMIRNQTTYKPGRYTLPPLFAFGSNGIVDYGNLNDYKKLVVIKNKEGPYLLDWFLHGHFTYYMH